jgi:hypothetical protein
MKEIALLECTRQIPTRKEIAFLEFNRKEIAFL